MLLNVNSLFTDTQRRCTCPGNPNPQGPIRFENGGATWKWTFTLDFWAAKIFQEF